MYRERELIPCLKNKIKFNTKDKILTKNPWVCLSMTFLLSVKPGHKLKSNWFLQCFWASKWMWLSVRSTTLWKQAKLSHIDFSLFLSIWFYEIKVLCGCLKIYRKWPFVKFGNMLWRKFCNLPEDKRKNTNEDKKNWVSGTMKMNFHIK